MRTSLPDGSTEFIFASDLDEGRHVQDIIESQLRQHRFEDKDVFAIRLALDEAIVNAIKHGNQMDACKRVNVRFRILADRFEVVITDEGPGYDPQEIPDPLAAENIERATGRGLFLMRHYMNEITVHAPGNRLSLCKIRKDGHRNGSPAH
jgi:serine/threonine-protein kinase RsbW